jgi:hypothetical protein
MTENTKKLHRKPSDRANGLSRENGSRKTNHPYSRPDRGQTNRKIHTKVERDLRSFIPKYKTPET